MTRARTECDSNPDLARSLRNRPRHDAVNSDQREHKLSFKVAKRVGVTPLLIKLPVGDLSFSWAWPLDPGPGDTKIGVLHVNIGLLF